MEIPSLIMLGWCVMTVMTVVMVMMVMMVTVVTVVTVVMVTSENWPSSCYKQAAFTVDAPGFGRMLGSSVGGIGIVLLALVILE